MQTFTFVNFIVSMICHIDEYNLDIKHRHPLKVFKNKESCK